MAASRDRAGEPPGSTLVRFGGDDVAWWSDSNGVYDRDDSLKENTNPKCLVKGHHPGHGGAAASSSQRFSGNLKPTAAPIIGLPGKLGQGSCARRHHPPAMFPKKAKTGGGGRTAKAAVLEPGSPKVSCIGKVLSDRERVLRRRPPKPPGTRPGCCGGFGFLMRRSRSRNSAVDCVDQSPPPPPLPPSAASRRGRAKEAETETGTEPPPLAPGLGGVRRFASGRRAAEWAAEMEGDDGRVARSGPL